MDYVPCSTGLLFGLNLNLLLQYSYFSYSFHWSVGAWWAAALTAGFGKRGKLLQPTFSLISESGRMYLLMAVWVGDSWGSRRYTFCENTIAMHWNAVVFFVQRYSKADHIVIKVASAESGQEGTSVMVIFVLCSEFRPTAYRKYFLCIFLVL